MAQVFADRELDTFFLQIWAGELVGKGILRKEFARFLWRLSEQTTEGADDPHEMKPGQFEEILDEMGVTIPLPVDENPENITPATTETKSPGDGDDGFHGDGVDLLVVMRLAPVADEETRESLSLARQAALRPRDGNGGNGSLKAVFKFDHAGAPHGLPERVMALSHKIGVFSSRARWRLGGLFLLHEYDTGDASSMILEYDKKSKTFGIEVLGQSPLHVQAMRFVISTVFHVARDFPGAGWTAWMECGMRHDGEKMYHLATSNETQVRMNLQ